MTLQKISFIVGIIVGVIIIIGAFAPFAVSFWDKSVSRNDISIRIEPAFIGEGQYNEGVPIKVILEVSSKSNITELEFSKDDLVITRLNKNDQTKVSILQGWKGYMSDEFIFNINRNNKIGSSRTLEAETSLWGCENCFMGEDSPYLFTFTIYYAKDGGALAPIIKKVEVPIK